MVKLLHQVNATAEEIREIAEKYTVRPANRIVRFRDLGGRKRAVIAKWHDNGEEERFESMKDCAEALKCGIASVTRILNGHRAQPKNVTLRWADDAN